MTNPPVFSRRHAAALTLIVGLSPMIAAAQDPATNFPSKPITLIVPYATGGSSDTRARQIGEKITGYLGKPVIVENKPGAAGNIGTESIARAKPDGHTIGIGNFAPLAVNKALFPKLAYDPATDLVPVALIEKGPLVMVVPQTSPIKTFKEFLDHAKANDGKVTYASAGAGGSFHLAGEMLESATGTAMVHIPYKGGGPATNDLLGGMVDFMFDMVPAALPYLNAKPPRLRALGLTTEQRLPQLPDVPTFVELGMPDMTASNWFGIVAPKGTPEPIVAKLNQAINRALKEPDVVQRITSAGNIVGGGTSEEFGAFIASESKRWSKLIKEKGVRPE